MFIVLNYRLFRRELFVILYFDTVNYIAMNQLSGRKAVKAVAQDGLRLGGVSRKAPKATWDTLWHFVNVFLWFPLVSEVFYTWRLRDNITVDMGYDERIFVPEEDEFLRSYRVVLDTLIAASASSEWYLHYLASIMWGTQVVADSAQYSPLARALRGATKWVRAAWRSPAGKLSLLLASPALAALAAVFVLLPSLLLRLCMYGLTRVKEGVFPSTLHVLGDLRYYPALLRRMRVLNLECLVLTLFCRLLLIMNLVVIMIFATSPEYHHFGGLVTLISALTNTEVVYIRVSQWHDNLSDAYANFAATSIFLNVPMRSNVVDANYRWSPELFMPAGDPARVRKQPSPAARPLPAVRDGGGGSGGGEEGDGGSAAPRDDDVEVAMPQHHSDEMEEEAKAEALLHDGEFDDWMALEGGRSGDSEQGDAVKALTFTASPPMRAGRLSSHLSSPEGIDEDGPYSSRDDAPPTQQLLRSQLLMAANQAAATPPPPMSRSPSAPLALQY